MFLHHILRLKEGNILREVYEAQKSGPLKGDWAHLIAKDRIQLELNINDDQIKGISKNTFKAMIKKKTEEFAFNELIKDKKTKTKN